MALSESIEYDKIEVVGQYKHVQVRKATVIKKDDKELTRSFERFVLDPGTLDASDNLVDNPLTTKEKWRDYRQQLRDITKQADPFKITWPTEPS